MLFKMTVSWTPVQKVWGESRCGSFVSKLHRKIHVLFGLRSCGLEPSASPRAETLSRSGQEVGVDTEGGFPQGGLALLKLDHHSFWLGSNGSGQTQLLEPLLEGLSL